MAFYCEWRRIEWDLKRPAVDCCRKESSFNLGTAETKLLYTLHWILLDAADECILESETAGTPLEAGPFAYLFPISAITVSLFGFEYQ